MDRVVVMTPTWTAKPIYHVNRIPGPPSWLADSRSKAGTHETATRRNEILTRTRASPGSATLKSPCSSDIVSRVYLQEGLKDGYEVLVYPQWSTWQSASFSGSSEPNVSRSSCLLISSNAYIS